MRESNKKRKAPAVAPGPKKAARIGVRAGENPITRDMESEDDDIFVDQAKPDDVAGGGTGDEPVVEVEVTGGVS